MPFTLGHKKYFYSSLILCFKRFVFFPFIKNNRIYNVWIETMFLAHHFKMYLCCKYHIYFLHILCMKVTFSQQETVFSFVLLFFYILQEEWEDLHFYIFHIKWKFCSVCATKSKQRKSKDVKWIIYCNCNETLWNTMPILGLACSWRWRSGDRNFSPTFFHLSPNQPNQKCGQKSQKSLTICVPNDC